MDAQRIAAYRAALRRLDFSAPYSDDYSEALKHERAMESVRREQKLIDPDRVIWNEVMEARNARMV